MPSSKTYTSLMSFIAMEEPLVNLLFVRSSITTGASAASSSLIAGIGVRLELEQCKFCQRIVVDDKGQKTEDFGMTRRGKYICTRCAKSLEFSLGI